MRESSETPSRRALGARAEAWLAEVLADAGWRVLGRNVRSPYAEIDVLALAPDGVLVAVEVKARHDQGWLAPEDTLRGRQRLRLGRAVQWCAQQLETTRGCRVDLYVVELRDDEPRSYSSWEDVALWEER